jgi:hypothetical protein
MAIVKLLVVVLELLASVTRTVTVWVDAAVGVPRITPVELSIVSPAGRVPESTSNVYGDAPPDLAKVRVYAELNVPLSPEEGVVKTSAVDTWNSV